MEFKSGQSLILCFFFLLSVFITTEALECYECIAVGSGTDECNGDIVTRSGNKDVVECDLLSMKTFHSKLHENSVLNSISSIFAVDVPQSYRITPMACVKMGLKVGSESVILRTCQIASTETVKPCEVTKEKIRKDFSSSIIELDYCEMCEGNKCNNSNIKIPNYIVTILLIFYIYLAA